MSFRILIVDDETVFAGALKAALESKGYDVHVIGEGSQLADRLLEFDPHLLLLDIMLPGQDGLALLKELRQTSDLPVILLTSRSDEADRLNGLHLGADDYICRPISQEEVVVRIGTLLRRTYRDGEPKAYADVPPAESPGTHAGASLRADLTPTEIRILELLVSRPGHVFSRIDLMDQIYPDNLNVSPRALDSHIKNLRRKLDRNHPGQPLIKAVYGVGFVYDADSAGQPRHDQLCVLFADVSNSRALYNLVGNEKAYALIEACLAHARDAVTRFNGKVIKLIGDEIMATFPKASDAADAACEIQRRVSDMAAVGTKKLTLHIGFHFGEVLCAGGDIYGETVNIAAQLTKQAKPGQILYTASSIDPDAPASFMVATDVSGHALSPGNTVEEEIVELQWRRDFTITQASGFARPLSRAGQEMQIRYNDQCYQLNLENRLMTIGRDPNCSIPVSNLRASRLHATFELKADGIYLIDRSTNGTYVSFEDRPEFCVKHKELLLRSHGRLSLGQSITRDSTDLLFFDIRSGDA